MGMGLGDSKQWEQQGWGGSKQWEQQGWGDSKQWEQERQWDDERRREEGREKKEDDKQQWEQDRDWDDERKREEGKEKKEKKEERVKKVGVVIVENSEKLPPNWTKYWDLSGIRYFYHNRITKVSQWEKPEARDEPAPAQTPPAAQTIAQAAPAQTPTPIQPMAMPIAAPHQRMPTTPISALRRPMMPMMTQAGLSTQQAQAMQASMQSMQQALQQAEAIRQMAMQETQQTAPHHQQEEKQKKQEKKKETMTKTVEGAANNASTEQRTPEKEEETTTKPVEGAEDNTSTEESEGAAQPSRKPRDLPHPNPSKKVLRTRKKNAKRKEKGTIPPGKLAREDRKWKELTARAELAEEKLKLRDAEKDQVEERDCRPQKLFKNALL